MPQPSKGQPCNDTCKNEPQNKCLPCLTPSPELLQDQEKQDDEKSCTCTEKAPRRENEEPQETKMPFPNTRVDMKPCEKEEAVHPCDPPLPCDPYFEFNECPKPYICLERLKNPAFPGEITTCKQGNFMYVKVCKKKEPPHPCDPLIPCSEVVINAHAPRPPCQEPPLCIHRVKNPDTVKKVEPCDPTK